MWLSRIRDNGLIKNKQKVASYVCGLFSKGPFWKQLKVIH